MGNWGVHVLDDAVNVVLRDRVPFPKRVAAAGGRVMWDDAGQTPNVCFAYYDTGSEPLLFVLSNLPDSASSQRGLSLRGIESGYVIQCEGGYYSGGRGGGTAHDHNGNVIRKFRGDSGTRHFRNFVDAVFAHDRNLLNAEVQVGHQSTAWCNLANVAMRVGHTYAHEEALAIGHASKPWGAITDLIEQHLARNSVKVATQFNLSSVLEFDGVSEQFVGEYADAANQLLRREYRQQFKVPAVA
jgi:hypothetical protein